MNEYIGKSAVVIGGSMAGILTARALSDHFATVTVVERDELPAGPEVRKGVPQARHLHALWAGGLKAIDGMLPGIREDFIAAGAVPLAMPTDVAWLTPAHRWIQPFPATQSLVSASRTLLEWVVRQRVQEAAGIEWRTGHEVTGIRLDDNGDVAGVDLRARRSQQGVTLEADLVVDASGRGSKLPEWLAAQGLPTPRETTVDSFLGYATRMYQIPADHVSSWKAMYIQPAAPEQPRGAIMFPIEGGRWLVTLLGGGGDYPPTDEDGFMAFASSLRDPLLHDVISNATPVSSIAGFRRTANRRRHYDKLAMPGRLLAIGDSLCAFNPVYGQGMTVAATEVKTLDQLLRACPSPDRLSSVVRAAQRAVVTCTQGPWMLATGSDLRYPVTEGAKPTPVTKLVNRYLDRILGAVADDEVVNAAFLRVLNMVDPPAALFHPSIARRALLPSRTSAGFSPQPIMPVPEPVG